MAEAAAAPGGAAEGPSPRKRKAWDGPPPAAGDLGHAQFWWYRDPYGVDQGPHATTTMRSWFEAGYIPAVTPLAASYYGEVPSEMWLAAELWESPETEAFVLAEGAAAALQLEAAAPDYIEAAEFESEKEGYVFKFDVYGLGYYKDEEASRPIEVTIDAIEAEKQEKLERNARARMQAFPKWDTISG